MGAELTPFLEQIQRLLSLFQLLAILFIPISAVALVSACATYQKNY